MATQHIVKNRILRQLSADELKSVQPWLTLVELRSNTVLARAGQLDRSDLFSAERHDLVAGGHANRRSDRNGHYRRRGPARRRRPHQWTSIRAVQWSKWTALL